MFASKQRLLFRQKQGALAGLGLILALGLWVALQGPGGELDAARFWVSDGLKWLEAIALLLIVLFWERRPLASIGLRRPGWLDLALIPGVVIAVLLVEVFVGTPLLKAMQSHQDLSTLAVMQGLPFVQKLSIVITAGVTEEIVYRGFAIERIEDLTGSTTLGIVISTALFVGMHLPDWGLATGIQQTLITLVLALAYVWRRNLWLLMPAHALIDALGVFSSAH